MDFLWLIVVLVNNVKLVDSIITTTRSWFCHFLFPYLIRCGLEKTDSFRTVFRNHFPQQIFPHYSFRISMKREQKPDSINILIIFDHPSSLKTTQIFFETPTTTKIGSRFFSFPFEHPQIFHAYNALFYSLLVLLSRKINNKTIRPTTTPCKNTHNYSYKKNTKRNEGYLKQLNKWSSFRK